MASDPILPSGSTPDPVPSAGGDPVVPTPLPSATYHPDLETPLAPANQTTEFGLTPNLAALIAVLFPPITSLVFLGLEKRNSFVRFWAMQSLLLGVAAIAFAIISMVAHWILSHILLGWLWGIFAFLIDIGFFAVWIIMLVNAFGGKEWNAPIIGPLARQQLNRPPLP